MSTIQEDENVRVGERRVISFTCTEEQSDGTYDPVDLTGATYKLHRKKYPEGPTKDATDGNGGAFDVTDEATGIILFTPTADYWNAIGVYQVYLEAELAGVKNFYPGALDKFFRVAEAH